MNDWTAGNTGIGTTAPLASLHIREREPIRCYLFLTNDLIRIDCHRPMPNIWVRFWLKLLLGWRWSKP